MTEAERFYSERDRRSLEYGIAEEVFGRPVAIVIGDDAAESERPQLLALTLVNMAARMHRRLVLIAPQAPLIAHRAMGRVDAGSSPSLRDAAVKLARAVDSFIDIQDRFSSEVAGGVGIGAACHQSVPWHIGSRNHLVKISRDPVTSDMQEGFHWDRAWRPVLVLGESCSVAPTVSSWPASKSAVSNARASFRPRHDMSRMLAADGPILMPAPTREEKGAQPATPFPATGLLQVSTVLGPIRDDSSSAA